jgi:hypothetical protein
MRRILGPSCRAQCAICQVVDHRDLFDVDHKIPRAAGGPNVPWNLWPLCLNHHRIKSRMEYHWLPTSEKRCFCCNKIVSKYFCSSFWCTDCEKLPMPIRIASLENNIKKEMHVSHMQRWTGSRD